MKQIDIIKTYAQRRCLVVEDIADIRASVKRWCVDFGCKQVDTAGNAEEAIDLCQRYRYNMILADYNLGPGKTGQQLLEELRHHDLVPNTALFVVITGEASAHYVLHTLEHQPDDYIYKPLSRESLRSRLDTALMKNEALQPVKAALDENAPEKAIKAALETLKNGGKYSSDIKRCLVELYGQTGQWEDVQKVCRSLAGENAPLWARLGCARALVQMSQAEDAELCLLHIIDEVPLCVEAKDLLAEVYEQQRKYMQAQQVLAEAVKISPLGAQRQRALGKCCEENGDTNAAVHAWRAALKNSKNTCSESPEDFLHLADNLVSLGKEDSSDTARDLADEALDTLSQLDKKYPRQPLVQIRSKQVEADIHASQGKVEESHSAQEAALCTHKSMNYAALEHSPAQLCIDCAKAFMDRGHFDAGEALLEELARINQDHETAIKIDKLRREPQTREGILHASKLNKKGIGYYQAGEFTDAQEAFENVLKELPNHIGLNLNLIQAIISKLKKDRPVDKDQNTLKSCLSRLGDIGEESPHHQRYQYLANKARQFID